MSRAIYAGGVLRLRCPGCGQEHHLNIARNERPRWTWNGDLERPTVSPSINAVRDFTARPRAVCHSYVEAGRIRFLPDCTHDLRGQTVDLPELVP